MDLNFTQAYSVLDADSEYRISFYLSITCFDQNQSNTSENTQNHE